MIVDTKGIPPGAVKDRQISKQAKIDPAKLKPVGSAQILIGQTTGKLSPNDVSGDATLAPDGTLTLDPVSVEGQVTKVLQNLNIEAGAQANIPETEIKRLYEDIAGVNTFPNRFKRDLQNAGSDNAGSTLVKRDPSGDIAVGTVTGNLTGTATNADAAPYSGLTGTVPTWNQDTTGNADTATNATNLNNQAASHYLDVANHTGQSDEHEHFTSQTPTTFNHSLGYIPDVTVYESDGATPPNYDLVDATVSSTNQNSTVSVSEGGVDLKVIIK